MDLKSIEGYQILSAKLNILGEQENIQRNVCSSILYLHRFHFYQSRIFCLSKYFCSYVLRSYKNGFTHRGKMSDGNYWLFSGVVACGNFIYLMCDRAFHIIAQQSI